MNTNKNIDSVTLSVLAGLIVVAITTGLALSYDAYNSWKTTRVIIESIQPRPSVGKERFGVTINNSSSQVITIRHVSLVYSFESINSEREYGVVVLKPSESPVIDYHKGGYRGKDVITSIGMPYGKSDPRDRYGFVELPPHTTCSWNLTEEWKDFIVSVSQEQRGRLEGFRMGIEFKNILGRTIIKELVPDKYLEQSLIANLKLWINTDFETGATSVVIP